jgi:L-histidine Nalpha-methyltransferase
MSMTSGASPLTARPDLIAENRLRVADTLCALRASPKRLAPSYLYDSTGSALFERICRLPEYYLTRVETDILRGCGEEVARLLRTRCMLVELGSGASAKTRFLLDRLCAPSAYVPVDISTSALTHAVKTLRRDYPALQVLPVCADFTRPFSLPRPQLDAARICVFFPGSTIGNFDAPDAAQLLRGMRECAGTDGALVVGVDLVKDVERLEAAYDDADGITAAFNLNVLRRMNRELGADFSLDAFEHEAVWVPEAHRIEMHLVSRRRQRVHVAGVSIEFARGDRLVTEHCHKYTLDGFAALAGTAGWSVRKVWTDEAQDFAVFFLV